MIIILSIGFVEIMHYCIILRSLATFCIGPTVCSRMWLIICLSDLLQLVTYGGKAH